MLWLTSPAPSSPLPSRPGTLIRVEPLGVDVPGGKGLPAFTVTLVECALTPMAKPVPAVLGAK